MGSANESKCFNVTTEPISRVIPNCANIVAIGNTIGCGEDNTVWDSRQIVLYLCYWFLIDVCVRF